VAGFVETPETLGHVTAFSHFLGSALPNSSHPEAAVEATLITVAVATALLGLLVAYLLFLRRPEQATALARSSPGSALHRLWFSGWGFDSLYHLLFVAPVVWVAQVNKGDFIDQIYNLVAWLHRLVHESLRLTQSGQVRWYAAGVGLGTVVLAAVVIFL
jgi:NADH-quinone oxidoreductase subunit L